MNEQIKIIGSYKELKQLFNQSETFEIIPETPMDYHPLLKEGCYGFNDTTKRNYIFSVDNVDDINGVIECHLVGHYDFNTNERCGYRCGNFVKCIWYLTVGEVYYYNVKFQPDFEYIPFVLDKVMKIAMKVAAKDVDQTRDNGGKIEHTDLSKPSRTDLKKQVTKRDVPKEDKDDYKDTLFDEDLRTSSNKAIKIAIEITKEHNKMAVNLGAPWKDEETHIDMVNSGKFDVYFKLWQNWIDSENEKYWKMNFPNSESKKMTFNRGRNYIRIIHDGSAYCFINLKNGDILKPASWNAPAKHARGNIFDTSSWKNCGPFGVTYLR